MFDTLTVPNGMKLRKAVLATAGAVALLAVAGTTANAADFYFYGDLGTQTGANNDHIGNPTHAGYQNYLTLPDPNNSSYYTANNVGVNVGVQEVYVDALGSGAMVTAAGFNSHDGVSYVAANVIENTRGKDDLGLGVSSRALGGGVSNPDDSVNDTSFGDSSQPLELAQFEVIRIDLDPNGIYQTNGNFDPTKLTDVVAYFSSIDGYEKMQVATSNGGNVENVDWSPNYGLPGDTPTYGGVPTYNSYYNASAGDGLTGPHRIDLSTLFGSNLGQYLFFREKYSCGCGDDDVLLMQVSYNTTTSSTDIPEPGAMAIFGFGVIGMAAVRRRKRAGAAIR